MRYHGLGLGPATRVSGVVYAVGGAIGITRPAAGSPIARRGRRSQAGSSSPRVTLALSAPLAWLALSPGPGRGARVRLVPSPVCICFYCYYPSVYATIQDVIEPRTRGMAMAVYFFVFYMFTAMGLVRLRPPERRACRPGARAGSTAAEASATGTPWRDVFDPDPGGDPGTRALGGIATRGERTMPGSGPPSREVAVEMAASGYFLPRF